MRIVFTGGGTGGHIFPLIAVAQHIQSRHKNVDLIFLGPCKEHKHEFEASHITAKHITTGKIRRYFSVRNIGDAFLLVFGFMQSYVYMIRYMPDVVFSKGGYGAFPVVIVAWMFRIPVIAHESDSVMGLTNKVLLRFVRLVITSFPSRSLHIPNNKTKLLGNPVRDYTNVPNTRNILRLHKKRPPIFIMGGSQGAEQINNLVFESLDMLSSKYEVIHQVGKKHIRKANAKRLDISPKLRKHYHCFDFLDKGQLAVAYKSNLIISRAGSGSIFEIANAKKPSILIPLASSAGDHQSINAHIYEDSGACVVLDPNTITPQILQDTIRLLMNNKSRKRRMSIAAGKFSKPDATQKIASLVLKYGKK